MGSFGSQIRNLHEKLHILICSNHIFMRFLKNRPPGPGGGAHGTQGLRGPMGLKDPGVPRPGPQRTHGPQGPWASWDPWASRTRGPLGPWGPGTHGAHGPPYYTYIYFILSYLILSYLYLYLCGIGAIKVAGNSCRHGRSAE